MTLMEFFNLSKTFPKKQKFVKNGFKTCKTKQTKIAQMSSLTNKMTENISKSQGAHGGSWHSTSIRTWATSNILWQEKKQLKDTILNPRRKNKKSQLVLILKREAPFLSMRMTNKMRTIPQFSDKWKNMYTQPSYH